MLLPITVPLFRPLFPLIRITVATTLEIFLLRTEEGDFRERSGLRLSRDTQVRGEICVVEVGIWSKVARTRGIRGSLRLRKPEFRQFSIGRFRKSVKGSRK